MTPNNGPLRHLDLKHLRQLMEVAEKGSIRAAAESLAITQPALSRSIRAMEADLDVKLVERRPSGTELTAMGTRLLKYARIIDANLALAEEEVRGFRDRSSRTQRIQFGLSWLAEALIAAPLIERTMRERPGVRLAMVVGDYETLAPQLMSGRLEFFIGIPPHGNSATGVYSEPLLECPAGVVVRAQHPLATRPDVSLADLVAAQWVLPAAGSVPRKTYDNCFLRLGAVPPVPVCEVQPLSPIIRRLLLDSNLVTILPLSAVERELSMGVLRALPFDGNPVFPIHITQRQISYPSPARDYVIGEIKRLFCERSGAATQLPAIDVEEPELGAYFA